MRAYSLWSAETVPIRPKARWRRTVYSTWLANGSVEGRKRQRPEYSQKMVCVSFTLHLLWASVMPSVDSCLSSFCVCCSWNCTLGGQQGFEVSHCSSDQTANCLLLPQRLGKVPLLGLGLEHLEKSARISRIFAREFLSRCLCFLFLLYFICAFWKCLSLPGFINPSPLLWGQEWAVYLHFTDVQTEWQVVPRAAFRRLAGSI